MLGDTAVAVNPKDKRYKKIIGKTSIGSVYFKQNKRKFFTVNKICAACLQISISSAAKIPLFCHICLYGS